MPHQTIVAGGSKILNRAAWNEDVAADTVLVKRIILASLLLFLWLFTMDNA